MYKFKIGDKVKVWRSKTNGVVIQQDIFRLHHLYKVRLLWGGSVVIVDEDDMELQVRTGIIKVI